MEWDQQAALGSKKVALEKSVCITWFVQGIYSILCRYSDSESVCVLHICGLEERQVKILWWFP